MISAAGVLWLCSYALADPATAPSNPENNLASFKSANRPSLSELQRLFYRAANLFHAVEDEYASGIKSHPVNPIDIPRFKAAAQAAEEYLRAAALYEKTAVSGALPLTGVPVATYIAAMSWYSAQDHERTLHFIQQMLQHYSDYRRPRIYIGDGADELTKRPIVDNLLLLKMDIKAKEGNYDKNADPLTTLNEIMADAKAVLAARRQWLDEINRLPKLANRQMLLTMEEGSGTSDQARAKVLPSLREMVEGAHEKLLPIAIKKKGLRAVKVYLKAGAEGEGLFVEYLVVKLSNLDRMLIAQMKKQAETALTQKKYDEAKNALRRLRAEFGENEEVKQYTFANLNKVTLGFKREAEVVFDLTNFKPQTKAYEYFVKMAETSEEPLLKGYAHFRAADAVGTMKKYKEGIDHLNKAIAIWNSLTPDQRPPKPSDLNKGRKPVGAKPLYYIEECEYFLGFYYGAGLKNYNKGIELQRRFADTYRDSIWVQEALWDIVLWYRWSNRDKQAVQACRVLIERCPTSIRAENARTLLAYDYKNL